MPIYNPPENEAKWQKRWEKAKLHSTNLDDSSKPKYYNLVMFPYPSGDKLHVGHWYNYAPADSWGRYMRMKGFNVFEPFGFDSFGLPAENYAIKTGVHPTISITQNVEYMQKQLHNIGTMYDWDKMVVTSSPEYYRWTQWVFLQLYKKGLAYRKNAPVNWCPSCQTVLANEQVVEGRCERCKSEVTKRDLTQWFFKIRDYAEKLLDFEGLEWPEKTKLMQRNWIGRSEGSDVSWKVDESKIVLDTYTTTVDTIFGVTFVVISPEHPELKNLVSKKQQKAVSEYIDAAKRETDIDRTSTDREKTGVFTGTYVLHPFTGEKVPLWVADYVLMTYGTGVVMGVPAHDQRDMDFAKKYKLPIVQSVQLKNGETFVYDDVDKYRIEGKLVDSGAFTDMQILEAREKITKDLSKRKLGKFKVDFKLRDWLVSRQRYWGAPIPIVYCKKCGEVQVPEEDLPVELPRDVDFVPKGDGKSPLNTVESFVKVKCPKCAGPAQREVDTMDTFVDSSWYFLRYPSAKNSKQPFDKKITNQWLPVDMYIGGSEHACMHLLYARFINMVLHDLGHVDFKEPFTRLVHQGFITKDGAKMSKSKGNVVSPDEFVSKYGSDIFRMYLMFMGPFTDGGDWSDKGITGIARFVERFYNLMRLKDKVGDKTALDRAVHKTIKKVTADIEVFHFNTAVAALMEFVNTAQKTGIDHESQILMTKLIAPLAPHLAEQIWEELGQSFSIFDHEWPKYNPKLLVETMLTLPVQVNGKLRGQISVAVDATQEEILELAKKESGVVRHLEGKNIIKEIYIPGKLVSLVVKD